MPLSFFIVILAGPRVIGWLRRQKIGDRPEFDQAEMNELMKSKAGVPTMGGVLIIAAIAATTILLGDLRNFYVLMAMVCLLWLGRGRDAADDWLKLTAARRGTGRQGLTTLEKLLFQIGLGVVLSYFTYQYGRDVLPNHTLYFPFFKDLHIALSVGVFIFIGTFIITGFSNAVNLTDGLDGLAAGCAGIVSFALVVLALIIGTMKPLFNDRVLNVLLLPYIQGSDQMAVLAGAMLGACFGFLWFNCSPASVFMGDTGSLAMGGLIGYIAIVIRQELLLVLIGGIFVAEAMSVIIQVGYFK